MTDTQLEYVFHLQIVAVIMVKTNHKSQSVIRLLRVASMIRQNDFLHIVTFACIDHANFKTINSEQHSLHIRQLMP